MFAREGAHSRSRVLHAHGDSTGREIARTLYVQAADLQPVEFHSFSGVLDLLVEGNRVCGALASDEKSGRLVEIHARAVLLATGGMGCVFSDTTNPDVATGDGVALAYRAGARSERPGVHSIPSDGFARGGRAAIPALRSVAGRGCVFVEREG